MEIIAKVSKGSRMDQIYISKARSGLGVGEYVSISPIAKEMNDIGETRTKKPYFYGLKLIEPIKLEIINKIFTLIERSIENIDNIIITGSFLDEGFKFNDIDILIVSRRSVNGKLIKEKIDTVIGVKKHIIVLSQVTLHEGLSTDPLYNLMLSKCISRKRLIYRTERKFDYKILDLHLLESKLLPENFDVLMGKQKYDLTRNLIAIKLFLENEKLTIDSVNSEIINVFKLKNVEEIKENLLNKREFINIYKKIFNLAQDKIFSIIKNDSK